MSKCIKNPAVAKTCNISVMCIECHEEEGVHGEEPEPRPMLPGALNCNMWYERHGAVLEQML